MSISWKSRATAAFYRGHGLGGNEVYPAVSAVPERLTHTHWIVDEGIRFLGRRDPDCPFMLWLVFEAPHSPFDPPEPFDRMYDDFEIPDAVLGDWVGAADEPIVAHRRSHRAECRPHFAASSEAGAAPLLRPGYAYRLPVGTSVRRIAKQRTLREHHHRHHLRSWRAPGRSRLVRQIDVLGVFGARADPIMRLPRTPLGLSQ